MSPPTTRFTLQDLCGVLTAEPDIDNADEITDANADREFAELGYDSLAVLELLAQLRRHYGVHIPDDALPEIPTPLRAVEYVNQLLDARTLGAEV